MALSRDKNKDSTPIGVYRAHITPIDRLIKTTVGRDDALGCLLDKLERNAKKRGGQHYLFIGPRGIGKTHFLSLIENAIQESTKLRDLYTVVRFPEENNRILCFADLLLGIIDLLADKEKDGEWRKLNESLSEAVKDNDIIDTVVPKLRLYRKKSGKTILLMIENLDTLFTEQMKKEQDIHRLRTFLMDSPCAALIGTSPVYFPGLYSNKSPFYDFFSITPLENLSEEETIDLIRKNFEWEERNDILDHFHELIPKIQALHTMTGGNPRLNVLLYELIAHDNLLDVKVQFQKLLDQISPFYQDRLKDLAPQERALLETMALMRDTPRTPAAIAARLRMKPQQASSLLKRMTDFGYLTVMENPDDRRSRIYCIKEGFFDLWLAMSESRIHRRRLPYLTMFFERYYRDRLEREQKRKELWEKLENDIEERKENYKEVLSYLSDLGDKEECLGSKIELAVHAMKAGRQMEAGSLIAETKLLRPDSTMMSWIKGKASGWIQGDTDSDPDAQQWLDHMVEYWKTRRSGDLEKTIEIARDLSEELSGKGLHHVRIELLKEALKIETRNEGKISLLLEIGKGYKIQGMPSDANEVYQQALSLCRGIDDKRFEGTTLNNISQIYHAQGDYDTAMTYLKQSLVIYQQIGNKAGFCFTLFNMGHIHAQNNQMKEAISSWVKVYVIAKTINLAPALQALANLAPKLGLPEGLTGWENLAQRD